MKSTHPRVDRGDIHGLPPAGTVLHQPDARGLEHRAALWETRPRPPLSIFLLLVGCATPDEVADSAAPPPELRVTEVPTVYAIAWDTEVASVGRLEYGLGTDWDHSVPALDNGNGLHHEARVALGAGQTWSWRIVDNNTPGHSGEVVVDPPPIELPEFQVSIGSGTPDGGYSVGATPVAGDGTAVWIVDSYGRYVWWATFPKTRDLATDARLSVDGHWVEWVRGEPGVSFHRRKLDGSADEDFPVQDIHHSFVQLPEGGWGAIVKRLGEIDGEGVLGEGIVEIATDGTVTEVFNAWDEVEMDPADGNDSDVGSDSIHANGLHYDEASNRYYLSSWARSSVFAIDRADGSLTWELGGSHGQFELQSGEPFREQHGPRIDVGGELMVFDNGGPSRLASRVVAYTFDEAALVYSQEWEWSPDPSVYAAVLGNPDRQPDGGLFVAWGAAGRLEHLDPDGTVDWRLDAALGGTVGYVHHLDTLLGSSG